MTSFYFLHKNIIENMNENCCKKNFVFVANSIKSWKDSFLLRCSSKVEFKFFFWQIMHTQVATTSKM